MQAQAEVELARVGAEAEEKRRADESDIKIKIAQIEAAKEQVKTEAAKEQARIEADKELKIKEMELQAQQATANSATTPPPRNKDAKSTKLPSFSRQEGRIR